MEKLKISTEDWWSEETQDVQWADCEFIVQEDESQIKEVFKCHKVVLAKSSPEFARLLLGYETKPILISDLQPRIFAALIKYIYTGKFCPKNYSEALKLCFAAHRFALQNLVDQATQFLWDKIQPNCACKAFEFAVSVNSVLLMDRTLKVIQKYTKEIITHPTFTSINKSTLITILQQEKLNITSELELVEAAITWAKSEHQRLQENVKINEILGDAIKHIRFLTLSLEEFAKALSKINFLNPEEKIAIIANISSPNAMELPDNICKITTKRDKPTIIKPKFTFYEDVCFEYIDPEQVEKLKAEGPIYVATESNVVDTVNQLAEIKDRVIETQIMFCTSENVRLASLDLLLKFNKAQVINKASGQNLTSTKNNVSKINVSRVPYDTTVHETEKCLFGTTSDCGTGFANSQQHTNSFSFGGATQNCGTSRFFGTTQSFGTTPAFGTTPIFGAQFCGSTPTFETTQSFGTVPTFHTPQSFGTGESTGLFGNSRTTSMPQRTDSINNFQSTKENKSIEKYKIIDLIIIDSKFNKIYSHNKLKLTTNNYIKIKFREIVNIKKDEMYKIYVICKNDGFFEEKLFQFNEGSNELNNETRVKNLSNSILRSITSDVY